MEETTAHIFLRIVFLHVRTPMCCQFWRRRAPKNPKESSNEIFKIMDMEPTSIKQHEWDYANMVPISTTKHKMFFVVNFVFVENFWIICLGPKQSFFHKVFIQTDFYDCGILIFLEIWKYKTKKCGYRTLKTSANATKSFLKQTIGFFQ